jgi:hypothetical protein
MYLSRLIVTLVISLAIGTTCVAPASADPAVVYNHGNNPGTTCYISFFGNEYQGFVTEVEGKFLRCHTELVSGTAVSNVTRYSLFDTCEIFLAPGGIASLTCRY